VCPSGPGLLIHVTKFRATSLDVLVSLGSSGGNTVTDSLWLQFGDDMVPSICLCMGAEAVSEYNWRPLAQKTSATESNVCSSLPYPSNPAGWAVRGRQAAWRALPLPATAAAAEAGWATMPPPNGGIPRQVSPPPYFAGCSSGQEVCRRMHVGLLCWTVGTMGGKVGQAKQHGVHLCGYLIHQNKREYFQPALR